MQETYNPQAIESSVQQQWETNQVFKAVVDSNREKFYCLSMFPYPSGRLHMGHVRNYTIGDVISRYQRMQGKNVMQPMGWDAFGLPAENAAIKHQVAPAKWTKENIAYMKGQLKSLGFGYDWDRELATCDPEYYRWEQWFFTTLIEKGMAYKKVSAVNWCPNDQTVLANEQVIDGACWRCDTVVERKEIPQWFIRITDYAEELLNDLDQLEGWPDQVKAMQRNWIGKSVGASVTFNVKDHNETIEVFTTRPDTIFGVSFMTLAPEHDLVSKITTPEQKDEVNVYIEATAKRSERDRMADVKTISGAFTGAYAEHPFTKEPIPIWIGDYVLASYGTGAVMAVPCGDQRDYDFAKHFNIEIPNIFEGVDISEAAFADKEKTVIANSDFLNGMNYKKATKRAIFELEQIGQGQGKTNYRLRDAVFSRQRYWGEPFPVYYVNGMPQMIDQKHLPITLPEVEKYLPTETGEPPLGRADVWAWDTQLNQVVSNDKIDDKTVFPLELNTMPGWAGSSWYFFRYMEEQANRGNAFATEDALNYWENVDLYIGGSEHATGHLLYARFWTKFLKDRHFVNVDEPFKKLINQGMILGTSAFVYRVDYVLRNIDEDTNLVKVEQIKDRQYFASESYFEKYKKQTSDEYCQSNDYKIHHELLLKNTKYQELINNDEEWKLVVVMRPIHVDVSFVNASDELDTEAFKNWRPEFNDAVFIAEEDGTFKVNREVEKMSKSKYNVVNPDQICEDYGADSLRLYEMFLGPLEQAKPWNTAGITGVHGFLKKLWKLYVDDNGLKITDAEPTKDNLKTLHKTIKKVEEDIENFSFNTSVSTFMIAVNELTAQKCTSRDILQPLLILVSPYAPHIAEELWHQLGNEMSISTAPFPVFEEKHLVESSKNYPISFNGKMRFTLELPLDMSKDEIEKTVMAHEKTQEQLQGRTPKKVIIVPGKIVNIVG